MSNNQSFCGVTFKWIVRLLFHVGPFPNHNRTVTRDVAKRDSFHSVTIRTLLSIPIKFNTTTFDIILWKFNNTRVFIFYYYLTSLYYTVIYGIIQIFDSRFKISECMQSNATTIPPSHPPILPFSHIPCSSPGATFSNDHAFPQVDNVSPVNYVAWLNLRY